MDLREGGNRQDLSRERHGQSSGGETTTEKEGIQGKPQEASE